MTTEVTVVVDSLARPRVRRIVAVGAVVASLAAGTGIWQVTARTAKLGTGTSSWTSTMQLSGCSGALDDDGEAFTVFAKGQPIHFVQSVRNDSRVPVTLTDSNEDPVIVVFETELDSPATGDDWEGTQDTVAAITVPPGHEAIVHARWPADSFGPTGAIYGIPALPLSMQVLGVSRHVDVPLSGTVLVMPDVEAGTDAFRQRLGDYCGQELDPANLG